MYRFFSAHYDVEIYDPNYEGKVYSAEDLDFMKGKINTCDVVLVCVPTPPKIDNACDISIVEEAISWITSPLIIIKSTVPPGTTDALSEKYGKRIVFSPEYCGESSYWTPYKFHSDVKETPFFIFGGEARDTSAAVDFYLPVTGPVKNYRQTSARAAEMAKYMENSFYATKIMFCYEFAEMSRVMGIDFNEVRELWLLDPRINPMHTAVFKENKKPFSGKCLPKDLGAIIRHSVGYNYAPHALSAVHYSNESWEESRETEP